MDQDPDFESSILYSPFGNPIKASINSINIYRGRNFGLIYYFSFIGNLISLDHTIMDESGIKLQITGDMYMEMSKKRQDMYKLDEIGNFILESREYFIPEVNADTGLFSEYRIEEEYDGIIVDTSPQKIFYKTYNSFFNGFFSNLRKFNLHNSWLSTYQIYGEGKYTMIIQNGHSFDEYESSYIPINIPLVDRISINRDVLIEVTDFGIIGGKQVYDISYSYIEKPDQLTKPTYYFKQIIVESNDGLFYPVFGHYPYSRRAEPEIKNGEISYRAQNDNYYHDDYIINLEGELPKVTVKRIDLIRTNHMQY